MYTSSRRRAMSRNTTIKNFNNNHPYLHVQYSQDVCVDEVAESMLSYGDGYFQDYNTLILSDWTQVEKINFQKDDLYSLASLSSLWDLNQHKISIAIVTGTNQELIAMVEHFATLVSNPAVTVKPFSTPTPAIQWLHKFVI